MRANLEFMSETIAKEGKRYIQLGSNLLISKVLEA